MRAAAGLALGLWAAAPALADAPVTGARYTQPTPRYDHAVLGDALEWGALELTLADGRVRTLTLPDTRVFEDTAPRRADLDGDGGAEVIVVETDLALGARLAVYGPAGLVAATPFIGATHRWLAPLGAADLDGDGRVEIAYIDRPHLLRRLRVWRLGPAGLEEVAALDGLTNHRIGEPEIGGGIRTCGSLPEIIAATPDWQRLRAVRLRDGRLTARDIGPFTGPESFATALACRI